MRTRLPAYGALSTVVALSGIVIAGGSEPVELEAAPSTTQRPNSIFSWGDYDGDGLEDAYVIVEGGHGGLLLNQGDGTLRDVSAESGLGGIEFPRFALWHDYDLDGHTDLFVGTPKGESHLFRNLGNSTFEDVAPELGLAHTGDDRQAHWLDYDADGWADLHVRTDTGDVLYHNLGGQRFEAVELALPGPTTPVPLSAEAADRPEGEEPSDGRPQAGGSGPGAPLPADTLPSPRTFRDGRTSLTAPHSAPTDIPSSQAGLGTCADGVLDQANLANCIQASSSPSLGRLYPITENLFVASGGEVVINGTTPNARLTVNGYSFFQTGEDGLDVRAGNGYSSEGGIGATIRGGDSGINEGVGGPGAFLTGGDGDSGGSGAVVRGGMSYGTQGARGLEVRGGDSALFDGGTGLEVRGGEGDTGGLGLRVSGGTGTSGGYGYGHGGVGAEISGGSGATGAVVRGGYHGVGLIVEGGAGYSGTPGAIIKAGEGHKGGSAGVVARGSDGDFLGAGPGIQAYGGRGFFYTASGLEATGGTIDGNYGGSGGTGVVGRGGGMGGYVNTDLPGGVGVHGIGGTGYAGGIRVGVLGESLANPGFNYPIPNGVGVLGRGDEHGVIGKGTVGVLGQSTSPDGTAIQSDGRLGVGTHAATSDVHVRNEQSAIVTIEADTDDLNEFDNARIEFSQDGGERTAHVGYKAEANGDNRFQIFATGGVGPVSIGTNAQERLRVTHAGRVGIGTATPSFLLEVRGSAGKPGGGAWSNASDLRLKKNVADLENALETLLGLRGVTYEYKDPEGIGELAGERIGFIAQEVEGVLPDWVEEGEDGFKRLTVRGFEALAVEALRELRNENQTLRAEMERQTREIEALLREQRVSLAWQARLEHLEALLARPTTDR